jgi:hypothetical protein
VYLAAVAASMMSTLSSFPGMHGLIIQNQACTAEPRMMVQTFELTVDIQAQRVISIITLIASIKVHIWVS